MKPTIEEVGNSYRLVDKSLYKMMVLSALLCFVVPCPIEAGEWNNREGDNMPLVISGTDYEIGWQRAQLRPEEFKHWANYAESFFGGTDGRALKLALEYRLTELEERYCGLIDEWRGIADAAGISIESVALGTLGARSLRSIAGIPIPDPKASLNQGEGCTAFGLTHSDRGPILGKTSDSHGMPGDTKTWPDEDLEIYDYSDGYRIMMFGYAIMNDQGLAVGDANAHYEGATNSGDGPAGRLAPIIARYCPTVDSAVSFIKDYTISDDGRHFCLVDSSGKVAAVEVAPGGLVNIRWGDSIGYAYVANTSPDTTMRAHDLNVMTDSAYTANSDHRLSNLVYRFSDPTFQFSFSDAESIIFSHDTLGAICQHGDSIEGQWNTTRSRLILPSEGKLYAAARADLGTSYHPCEHAWRIFEFPPLEQDKKPLAALPLRCQLDQNYPNPFNAHTTLTYRLATSGDIEVAIYNLLGERLLVLYKGLQTAGEHSLVWDGTDEAGQTVASGVYYYRLEASDNIFTKRMALIK